MDFAAIEAAARVDGSAGWNLCIEKTAQEVLRLRLPEQGRAEVFATPEPVVAGAFSPSGVSVVEKEDGFVFDGVIPFASGSDRASWFMAGGMHTIDGVPVLLAGLVPREQVKVLDTWHVSGLRGTASCDVEVRDVFVPAHRCLTLVGPTGAEDPYPGLPLMSRLGCGLAWAGLGIAAHAFELLKQMVTTRRRFGDVAMLADQFDVQAAVGEAAGLLASGRALLHTTWTEVVEQLPLLEPRDLADLRLAYVTATRHALAVADLAYEMAGSAALYEKHGLEGCWRDLHALAHHMAVSPRHLPAIGRVHLGLPAGTPFI
ncbi:MAG: hypothetical protein M3P04_07525 [Actinomycetota bacterium]|nr:hypothetical protein [Actinomycetota bacterium]